jgi:hypothetical protein
MGKGSKAEGGDVSQRLVFGTFACVKHDEFGFSLYLFEFAVLKGLMAT